MSVYRQAEPQDIVAGAIVHILGDDGDLHAKMIEEVLRPEDQWKAFSANDGCRYGLDGCFIEKPTTAAEIEAWSREPTRVRVYRSIGYGVAVWRPNGQMPTFPRDAVFITDWIDVMN